MLSKASHTPSEAIISRAPELGILNCNSCLLNMVCVRLPEPQLQAAYWQGLLLVSYEPGCMRSTTAKHDLLLSRSTAVQPVSPDQVRLRIRTLRPAQQAGQIWRPLSPRLTHVHQPIFAICSTSTADQTRSPMPDAACSRRAGRTVLTGCIASVVHLGDMRDAEDAGADVKVAQSARQAQATGPHAQRPIPMRAGSCCGALSCTSRHFGRKRLSSHADAPSESAFDSCIAIEGHSGMQ